MTNVAPAVSIRRVQAVPSTEAVAPAFTTKRPEPLIVAFPFENDELTSSCPTTLAVPPDSERTPTVAVPPLGALSVPALTTNVAPDASVPPVREYVPVVRFTEVPEAVVQVPPDEDPPPVGDSVPLCRCTAP
ncbi:MAG TPA: hypothetical protein VK778_07140 [Solirubrobacteraceae bacterium]|nr:hypothetical protein [Solirubrobacteraceae bacterium]